MADVRPFAALRPRAGLAPRVAAVPYDVVNAEEARALASDPISFLHVSRAEIDLPPATDPYADAVYAQAVTAQAALRASSLEVEARPAIYLYRLTMGGHVQTGVAAAYSVDEYRRNLVKKHEKTRPDKENDRTRHIIETRAQSGPVLLTYARSAAVDAAVAAGLEAAPLYEFTAPDGIGHAIWRTEPAVGAAIVQAFRGVPALYIADGHHRAASAARADERLKSEESGAFLGVAFPDTGMQILPYHRAIKDLNGLTPEAFLADVEARATVRPGGPDVAGKGQCAMYLRGAGGVGSWRLVALDGGPAIADPVAGLDVQRLHDRLLAPVLGIGDERTDKRIDFVGGIRGPAELARLVDSGKAAVAFAMFPTTIDDLVAIADAGGIMPPKSTWFEPKLRDGLLTHLI
ncbi:MAG: DUF1015 family protein [Vicinamibacteraceae bacterium]